MEQSSSVQFRGSSTKKILPTYLQYPIVSFIAGWASFKRERFSLSRQSAGREEGIWANEIVAMKIFHFMGKATAQEQFGGCGNDNEGMNREDGWGQKCREHLPLLNVDRLDASISIVICMGDGGGDITCDMRSQVGPERLRIPAKIMLYRIHRIDRTMQNAEQQLFGYDTISS
ncbi:hypothetical protein L873DRAFT_1789090 [Choiromyces venosus 120613-1]|uniref:Uncharacterized protein n=1 Tax=Choiromyces venosus 120613-1 TaxID=1336337 RepID=A0A3N4JVF3_9PEZI|nr:hypothetical protein L873DRAFT_1789090 [Choiromyces venosus 120613-1]